MSEQRNILTIGTNLHGKDYVYEVVKVLGQGSFGITYLAKVCLKGALGSLQGTIHVAIKEFYMKEMNSRSGTAVDSGKESRMFHSYREKFRKEALNLSRMNHPGIVKVLEVFDENNTSYIVMEYLTGGTLDATIKEKSKLPEAEAMDTVSKIGLALSYMHDQRMLHLDLKPQNVMFDNAKQPVLIDFGLSKHFEESGEPESSTSIGLGTPGYAPIEQVDYTGGAEFQPTLDIYALGATLYKSLTGQTPPTASTVLNRPTLLHDRLSQAGVSEGTRNVVLKAMQPLKNARPQTVKEFLSMMESTQQVKDSKNIEDENDESTILSSVKNELKPVNVVQDVQPTKELKAEINKDLKEEAQNPLDNGTPAILSLEPDEDESTLLTAPVKSVGKQTVKKVSSDKDTNNKGEKKVSVSQPSVIEKNPIASETKMVSAEKGNNKSVSVGKVEKRQKGVKADEIIKQPESVVHEIKSKSVEPVLKQNDKQTAIDDATKKAESEMDVLSPMGTGPAIDFKNASSVYLDRFGAVVTDISDLEFQNEMAIVQQYGLYGFVNRKNQLVVGCKYDMVESYENGYASVRYHGRYGLIDRSGREVTPCVYEQEVYYSEGLIALNRQGKWGYVDLDGKTVIPFEYDNANFFCNGLAAVKKNNGWGYIDKTGRVVIPLDYQGVDETNKNPGPLYGMQYGMKWGYVNNIGEKVIPFLYDNVGPFYHGLAAVQDGKWNLINEKGIRITPSFQYIYYCSNTQQWIIIGNNDKKGLLDKEGNVILKLLYSHIGFYINGLRSVQKDEKYGFIDSEGKEVIPCEYEWTAGYFIGNKVLAKRETYFIMDRQGNVVRNLDYSLVIEHRFNKDWLLASSNGKEGIIDFKGDIILPFEYEEIKSIPDTELLKVRQNKLYGLLDKNLNYVIPPVYTYMEDSFHEGLCRVGKEYLYGFINPKGEEVIPISYVKFTTDVPFKNGITCLQDVFINRKNEKLKDSLKYNNLPYTIVTGILFFLVFYFLGIISFIIPIGGYICYRRNYKKHLLNKGYHPIKKVFSNGISNYYNDSAYLVSNGLLAVCRVDNWGFIDKNHNEVIPPRYKWVSLFDEKSECWAIQANGEDLEVIKVNTKGEERKLTYEEKVEWETNWKF